MKDDQGRFHPKIPLAYDPFLRRLRQPGRLPILGEGSRKHSSNSRRAEAVRRLSFSKENQLASTKGRFLISKLLIPRLGSEQSPEQSPGQHSYSTDRDRVRDPGYEVVDAVGHLRHDPEPSQVGRRERRSSSWDMPNVMEAVDTGLKTHASSSRGQESNRTSKSISYSET